MKKNLIIIINLLLLMSLIVFLIKTSGEKQQTEKLLPPITPIPEVKPEDKSIYYEDALSDISEKEIKEQVEYLSSEKLEGRMSGKKGNVLAAEYLKELFESYGLETEYQKFSIKRLNPGPNNELGDNFTQNILAYMEGKEFPNEVVVVGAHMDHIGYGPSMSRSGGGKIHPGADDNASGTAALMQIAESCALLKGQNKRTIVFIAFSAEEMGLIGSRYYCDNPMFPRENPNIKNHVFMLNMDMVGYLGQARKVFFNEGESSIDVSSIIGTLSKKYDFAKSITGRNSGGSDHASFYNKKIPIAFLHTGLHDHYHKPSDTADKLNYSGIEKIAKYGFELTWNIVNNDAKPTFNYDAFKVMDYTHDHGYPMTDEAFQE